MGLALRPGTSAHVVAVVVHRDPPPERWDAVLAALAAQHSVPLSVVVVDIGAREDPVPAVRRRLPDARVVRLGDVPSRGAAVNRVVAALLPGARPGYLLVCHDDAAPEPGVLRALVDAALEWEADVVGAKLVGWDDPRRLVDVGRAVDRLGVSLPYVERGEIDQGQHDGLREVFTSSGACVLVRTELFTALGGFDEAIDGPEEELSLCWRARVAGARVLVTTAARVRHAETPQDPARRERLAARHRLRVVLTCYGVPGVLWTLPLAAGVTVVESLGALATGRFRRAAVGPGAWRWNARRPLSLLRVRWRARRARRVSDREIRRLQVPGIIGARVRLRRLQRGTDAVSPAGPARAAPAPPVGGGGWSPASTLVALGLAAVVLFGSRHLLTQGVPAVGEVVPFGNPPGDLVTAWARGARDVGLGPAGAVPTGVSVLGAVGALLGSAAGVARTVLTVGLLPIGVLGAYRLLGPAGSKATQLTAGVAYASLPLPYNALAAGRLSSLAAYAAAPWLLGRLARASGSAPFGPWTGDLPEVQAGPATATEAPPGVRPHPMWRHVVATGAVAGLAALLVPQAPALLAGTGLALVVGSVLAGRLRGVGRVLVAAAGGAVLAALLHLPLALDIAGSRAAAVAWLGREPPPGGPGALDILRFQVGEVGDAPLGFALVGAAALPLLVGRDWRLGWAIRGWVLALGGWGFVWAQSQGWAPWPSPHPDVVLAPAAAGLVLALALGVAAIGADVRGRSRRLGIRRLATGAALLTLAAATLPAVSTAMDGWWGMPRGDFREVLAPVDEAAAVVPSRVLWLGHPDVLPGGRGWPLGDGVDYAVSTGGSRGLAELWPGAEPPAARRIAAALDLAMTQETSRLGRLLAPSGVQFVVVPLRAAPTPYRAVERPVPEPLLGALAEQLDLARTDTDAAVLVYRNTAFTPEWGALADPVALEATPRGEARRAPWIVLGVQGALWFLAGAVALRMRFAAPAVPVSVPAAVTSRVVGPPVDLDAEPAASPVGAPNGMGGDGGNRDAAGGNGRDVDTDAGGAGDDSAGDDGAGGEGPADDGAGDEGAGGQAPGDDGANGDGADGDDADGDGADGDGADRVPGRVGAGDGPVVEPGPHVEGRVRS